MNDKLKEFKPTSWSIDNKTSIFVLVIIITVFGLISYNNLPKERVPDIIIPTIFVSTPYPGNSPSDIENLITRPIEKNIKSINGVKNITSKSVQDYSLIVVEFNPNIDVADAKQKVKDAVDKSKKDLPNNLLSDPSVKEIDFSEIPIMYVNLSGDFDLNQLKKYAEELQDKIEGLKEITRVDIVGALDREIQVNVDMFRMEAVAVTFSDIERAISAENLTVSGGQIDVGNMKRSVRVVGQFKDIETIKNIVIRSSSGASVYLKDIAEVIDSYKERESYARLDEKNVITLNVIKKSGENLLDASDKIKNIIEDMQKTKFPEKLRITISNDMSKHTRITLDDLNNTIIIGFILVTIILMFFMGFTNAFFVGLSVPLSMFIAYIVLPSFGFTMNMLVMFSFIFALGIVVDDAIVIIENTHRIYKNSRMTITEAAKYAAGEIFLPVLSGTLTTLAPFFPLIFWPGIVGKFMHFIPVTIILVLFASLFVAYIINPVFAVVFMKKENLNKDVIIDKKNILKYVSIFLPLAILAYIIGWVGIGNFLIFVLILILSYKFFIHSWVNKFQNKVWPAILGIYEKVLRKILCGRNAYRVFWGTIILLFLVIFATIVISPKIILFPSGDPNNIMVYLKLPIGTNVNYTDSVTRVIENKIYNIIGKNNEIVESVTTNVALGANDPYSHDPSVYSNRAKITVSFVEYAKRKGESTKKYLNEIRNQVKSIPGVEITIEQNKMGPPTGKPINIEITGDDIDLLYTTSQRFKKFIEKLNIEGIENLKSDFDNNKPEITLEIDRVRANKEGIMTGQIASAIRTAIYGSEASKFKENEDEYPIQIRYKTSQRNNIENLLNTKITYRDMNSGMLRQISIANVVNVSYTNSYSSINRKNLKRIITLSSEVTSGHNANQIIKQIKDNLSSFNCPEGIEIKFTGEREDQAESSRFLGIAMLLALCLIFFILITQFNSVSKPIIILSEILFSTIGVFLGIIIFNMDISVILTGMGIVALGGIVVRNGILLVEFTDILKERGYKTREAIIIAGKTRITPVILTATATMLGLVPLAVGFNIDFVSLFKELNPHIYFGGDNVAFFGPLAWTIIFGLSFATFLTLLLIPAMYFIAYESKIKIKRSRLNPKRRR